MINHQTIIDLTKWLDEVHSRAPVKFDSITPSIIPSDGGIYFISDYHNEKKLSILVNQAIFQNLTEVKILGASTTLSAKLVWASSI